MTDPLPPYCFVLCPLKPVAFGLAHRHCSPEAPGGGTWDAGSQGASLPPHHASRSHAST